MTLKIPPPPPLPDNQILNRWFLELTSILQNGGGLDPNQIPGYATLQNDVVTNTTGIGTLNTSVASVNAQIISINGQIITINSELASLSTSVTTINGEITALQANAVVRNGTGVPGAGLGANGDLYIDNNYPGTNRLYAKIGGTWKSIV